MLIAQTMQPLDNGFRTLGVVMYPIEKKIADGFAAFETEQDPQLLYVALNEIEDVQRYAVPEHRDACRRGLSLLLSFMAELEPHIDAKWERKKVPPLGVPLPVPDLPVYGTGEVDPAAIADPAIRARYEQELKTNRENWVRYNVQFQLRGVEERAVDDLKLFAERCFAGSSANRQEYEQLLNTSSLSDRLKKKFRKLGRPRLWRFG